MSRRMLAAGLVVALVAETTGCTALARLEAPALCGSPDSSAVVVVEPDITVYAAILGIRTSANAVSGLLVRLDGAPQSLEGRLASGKLIFPDVPPGKWQLLFVEADWRGGNRTYRKSYGVPLENAASFVFDVRAGEPVYVGAKIEEDFRSDSAGVRFARSTDADDERDAWRSMSDIYADTAWGPIFRAKLDAPGDPRKAEPTAKSGG